MLHRLKFLLVLLATISICNLRGEVAVSYAPYATDEVVIKTGGYRMTAQELAKYGLEAIQVTIKNNGLQEEQCVCEYASISRDEVYKKLKYSSIKAFCKSVLLSTGGFAVSLFAFTGIMRKNFPDLSQEIGGISRDAGGLVIKFIPFIKNVMQKKDVNKEQEEVLQKAAEDISSRVFQIVERITQNKRELNGCIYTASVFLVLPVLFLYPLISAYRSNAALNTFLQNELLTEAVTVPAGQTVTKLMLVKKMERTDAVA